MRLTQIIEALLFASDAPLSAADLSRVDERLDEDTVEAVIQELRAEYELSDRSFQIYEVAGGFQLLTRPEFVTVLERYDSVPQPSRLSAPALEVLAIIAYRQPLGRAEVEEIRGVGSSGVLRTLQERNLIEPVARGEGLGRPLLYGTTKKFLEHFGFRSLEDLPRPDELPVVLLERTNVVTTPLDGSEPAAGAQEAPATAEGDAGATPDAPAAGADEATSADEGAPIADAEPVAELPGAGDEAVEDGEGYELPGGSVDEPPAEAPREDVMLASDEAIDPEQGTFDEERTAADEGGDIASEEEADELSTRS